MGREALQKVEQDAAKRAPKDPANTETLTARLQSQDKEEKHHNLTTSYPTMDPVESRSFAIWGIEGTKAPATKTNRNPELSARRLGVNVRTWDETSESCNCQNSSFSCW